MGDEVLHGVLSCAQCQSGACKVRFKLTVYHVPRHCSLIIVAVLAEYDFLNIKGI